MAHRLTGANPRLEQRRQQRLLGLLERKYRGKFSREITRASKAMLAKYKASGSVPATPDEHELRLKVIYEDLASDAVKRFGTRITDQGKSAGLVPETKNFAEFFSRIAGEYVLGEMVRERIVRVATQTRQGIVDEVLSGQSEGLGVAAIARNIAKAIPSISKQRGAVIARTESHGAANAGADAAARATGLRLQKEWVATSGGRTRSAHARADGQVVDMDQPFIVDGERLRYPGDPSGSAGNIINCRCGVSHIVLDEFD